MKITKRPFGTLADGTAVSCWTMENAHGLRAELLDYGATICSVQVPDRAGRLIDVVLGYDDLAGYAGNPSFYGATIGRFGNRIGGAEFALNGKTYWLAKNNGENHLHGGLRGFDKYVWQGTEEPDGVRFTRVSPDGEEGYPGTLTVSVKFSWQGDGLMLHYTAQCDQDTILNLTNHSYFNLDGEGTVQEQLLKIHADYYTPNDAGCLPTGELAPVAGTAIVMCVTTDQPGVQLFTANHMKERIGKNGQQYGHRSAFCLETQHFPDCIHHPDWPSCVLRAGEVFDSKTIYSFTTE